MQCRHDTLQDVFNTSGVDAIERAASIRDIFGFDWT